MSKIPEKEFVVIPSRVSHLKESHEQLYLGKLRFELKNKHMDS